MSGSVLLGENHLVIDKVQLDDDASYQCQVGPSAGDPPLLGKATLSVTGRYTSVLQLTIQ